MSITIDDFRCKLINKILLAPSQDEVKRFVDASMKSLQAHNVNKHIIARFIEKMLQHLSKFNAMNHDAKQWSNIKMAKRHSSKHRITEPDEFGAPIQER
jgi:hypothetical protein